MRLNKIFLHSGLPSGALLLGRKTMTHTVHRGIGYTVERNSRGEVKVYLPYLSPDDAAMLRFRAPSVVFPADAAPNGITFDDMPDSDVIAWVQGNIAG